MWVVCNCTRFPATRPRVFCELKIMKIVILIYQIIQEKFAYGELFMLVMIGYIFMFKMVKKMQNSGLEILAGLTRPLRRDCTTNQNWACCVPCLKTFIPFFFINKQDFFSILLTAMLQELNGPHYLLDAVWAEWRWRSALDLTSFNFNWSKYLDTIKI